jgi:hypothetical protein
MGEPTDAQSDDEGVPPPPPPPVAAVRPVPLSVMNWEKKGLPSSAEDPPPTD